MKIGNTRPTYFCMKEDNSDILWFIPMSSKVEKFRNIRNIKIKKYGNCDTIIIKKFLGKEAVFLLQNMFPTIEKYVDHSHIVNNMETKVIDKTTLEIERAFKKILRLINSNNKVIFTNVEKDIKIMKDELKKEKRLK